MCSNIGTPKTINFPFGTNGKLMVLDVPILKHFRVFMAMVPSNLNFAFFFFFFINLERYVCCTKFDIGTFMLLKIS